MTTTVIKVVGTLGGADYSDWQTWEDHSPVDLRAGTGTDQIYRGTQQKCNLTTSTTATLISIAGTATDSAHYLEMTTAAGASYRDDPSIRDNPSRYDESKGASISTTRPYGTILSNACDYTRISNLQFFANASHAGPINMGAGGGGTPNCDVNCCIIEGVYASGGADMAAIVGLYGAGQMIRSSLVVQRASGMPCISKVKNGAKAINCTFAVPSDLTKATVANIGAYGAPSFINCVFVGVNGLWNTGTTPTFTTCYTDAIGTTGVTSGAYGGCFVNTLDATRDFRIPSTSPLKDAGTVNSNSTVSISGDLRGNGGTNYDIGAWEFFAAVTSSTGGFTGTLGGISLSASSSVAVGASATPTLAAATQAATATVPANATATGTLAGATLSGLAAVAVSAGGSNALADASLAAAAAIAANALLAGTLDAATLAADVTSIGLANADLNVTLGAASLGASASVPAHASAATTLDAAGLGAAASVPAHANATTALDAATAEGAASTTALSIGALAAEMDAATVAGDASAVPLSFGTLASELEAASAAADASVAVNASGNAQLAPSVLLAVGNVDAVGNAVVNLDALGLTATIGVPLQAALDATLGVLTLQAFNAVPVTLGSATATHGVNTMIDCSAVSTTVVDSDASPATSIAVALSVLQ